MVSSTFFEFGLKIQINFSFPSSSISTIHRFFGGVLPTSAFGFALIQASVFLGDIFSMLKTASGYFPSKSSTLLSESAISIASSSSNGIKTSLIKN
ncbi:MAG: hypothetical protein EAX96_16090 [Candidatus Lokiarchaeota archaeon]|nr:hypothetical protein [Candidatus Lokiarchaeota archaeon]